MTPDFSKCLSSTGASADVVEECNRSRGPHVSGSGGDCDETARLRQNQHPSTPELIARLDVGKASDNSGDRTLQDYEEAFTSASAIVADFSRFQRRCFASPYASQYSVQHQVTRSAAS